MFDSYQTKEKKNGSIISKVYEYLKTEQMKRLSDALITLLAVVFLSACAGRNSQVDGEAGDTLALHHSTLLTIVEHDGYTKVDIASPWREGEILHTYLLVPTSDSLPSSLPQGTVVRTPLQTSAVFMTAHCYLLGLLNANASVKAVADVDYIGVNYIKKGVESGDIIDVGSSMNPSIEKMVEAKIDAVLVSPFENSGGYGRLEHLGIPIIECADYMETTPLARAEWMRFYGLLYGKEAMADSLFNDVERGYNFYVEQNKKEAMEEQNKKQDTRPIVLTERVTGGTWYVPGGKSYVASIIADAGGRSAFSDDDHSGSLALSFEKVLEKASDADIWLVKHSDVSPLTRDVLLAEKDGYKLLKPMRTDNVFVCNTLTSGYYEETPFRPDFLLRDLTILFHPKKYADSSPKYYLPLSSSK